MKLLTVQNAKTVKGEKHAGYLTGILYLNPAGLCPWSTSGCRAACLYTAGRGAFQNVKDARTAKAAWFKRDKDSFIYQLKLDIESLIRTAARLKMKPAVRLNGTSDILWEREAPHLFIAYRDLVTFYDYTKAPYSMRPNERLPRGYHLTFSASEKTTQAEINLNLSHGRSVAIVSRAPISGAIDGDAHDLRFLDRPASIIQLTPKGKARKDETSGFVRI